MPAQRNGVDGSRGKAVAEFRNRRDRSVIAGIAEIAETGNPYR
jgi:hypothetical protein